MLSVLLFLTVFSTENTVGKDGLSKEITYLLMTYIVGLYLGNTACSNS